MKREIYEGNYKPVSSLESAILVHRHTEPGPTAEGVEVSIRHLLGVTIKFERYEDAMKVVAPGPIDLSYKGLMKITLYGQDDYTLGNMERVILEEIGKR